MLGAGALVLTIAGILGALGTLLPWVLAVTVVLVSLFVLRKFVNGRRAVLQSQVRAYCEFNELDSESLRAYYEAEGIYPYFLSLFPGPEPRS